MSKSLQQRRSTKAVSDERRAKIVELHDRGLTNNRIAARLGITQPAVSYHLRRVREEAAAPPRDADHTAPA